MYKRKRRNLISIFIMIILIGITSCTIPEGDLDFSETTYTRDEDYDRTFSMHITETDTLSVAFQKGVFSMDEMQSITNEMISDIDLIQQISDKAKASQTQIYVLDKTINGSIQIADSKVFCAKKDLHLPEFQRALIQACLGISEPWMIHGLRSVLFNDSQDHSDLSDYYANNNDLKILSLFGAYFYPEFNENRELHIAESTAASLVDFILKKYDYETLVDGTTPEHKTEWLHHIGVDKSFEQPDENDLAGFSFSRSDKYPIIINTDDACYNLIFLEDELSSANDIRNFIINNKTGRRTVLSYLDANTSENNQMINANAFYRYYIGDYAVNHSSVRGEIELNNSIWAHLHEAVHVMIRPEKLIVFEGLANYLSMLVYSDPFIKENIFDMFVTIQHQFNNGVINESDAEYKALKYFKDSGGNVGSPEGINLHLYCDTSAFINLSMEFGGPSERSPIYEIHNISESKRVDGDELSYMQACSFIAFLLEKHTLDDLLDFGRSSVSFQEVFGNTYEDAKSDWIRHLESKPGD